VTFLLGRKNDIGNELHRWLI